MRFLYSPNITGCAQPFGMFLQRAAKHRERSAFFEGCNIVLFRCLQTAKTMSDIFLTMSDVFFSTSDIVFFISDMFWWKAERQVRPRSNSLCGKQTTCRCLALLFIYIVANFIVPLIFVIFA